MFDQVLKSINAKPAPPAATPPARQPPGRPQTVMEKIGQLGLEVQELEGEVGGEEQANPMIISGEHFYPQRPVDKLKLLRVRNRVSELRQLHWDLADLIEEQRNITQIHQEGIVHQVIDFFMAHRRGGNSGGITSTSTELQGARDSEALLRKAHQELQREHEQVLAENEHLQEHIFDIEQKIVGVDLEVERKLNEFGKGRSGIAAPESSQQQEVEQQQRMIEHLNQEIGQLQEQVLRYQKMVLDEQELNERMKRVEQMELQWTEREASLRDAAVSIEQQKDANYQREHQILVAEENLSAKIAEVRKKEAELSEWEAQLARKAAYTRKEAPSRQLHSSEDFHLANDQESIKSFGAHTHSHNPTVLDSPAFVVAPSSPEVPPRPARPPSNPNYNINILPSSEAKYEREIAERQNSRKFTDSAYAPRRQIEARKHVGTASRYKDSREVSPYRANEAVKRSHQHINSNSRYNSPSSNFRELSKHSRHSANKSIRGHQPTASLHDSRGREQIGGLGSKLERLREEIKREIDSIK